MRELQNFIEGLTVFADNDVVGAADVEREMNRRRGPRSRRGPPPSGSAAPISGAPISGAPISGAPASEPDDSLKTQTAQAGFVAVQRALARAGGNRQEAARILGVSKRTIFNRIGEMREAGIPVDVTPV